MPCSQVPYCSCLCLLHVRSKWLKVMVDCQDSNLCNSGKLMVKILNMVIVVTTWRMGVTPHPPLSLDQLYQNPKTHLNYLFDITISFLTVRVSILMSRLI